jgi:hypothetical protein
MMRTVATSRCKKIGGDRGTTWLLIYVFWSPPSMPVANLFFTVFDRIQGSLSCSPWHACSADAVSALHVYSSIDVFGEKEKDWETHVRELCGFSDNLHFPELETF